MPENPFYGEDDATETDRRRRHETMPHTDQRSTLDRAALSVEVFKDTELSFSFPHSGGVFTRLARSPLCDFEGLDLIDLLTLRAHLTETAFLVANAIARHEQQR